jgi:hypothetical protein
MLQDVSPFLFAEFKSPLLIDFIFK